MVISASGHMFKQARSIASSSSRPAADKRLGVPPPMNTDTTWRPQMDGNACSRSLRSASR